MQRRDCAPHNPLVAEALINGHVAAQVLAIRRLTERTPKERLSLRWLVSDLKKHIDLFTRENWVCYDGLPYDYQVVRDAHFSKLAAKKEATVSFMWGATEGPEADGASEIMHQHFDSSQALILRREPEKTASVVICSLPLTSGSTRVVRMTWRSGPAPILRMRAVQTSGRGLPTWR